MRKKVFFKIVIPVFDSEEWVEKCIKSALAQTFGDFVIVAVDDKSTDSTFEKVQDMALDSRIKCLKTIKKLWNGGARNMGIHYNDIESEYTLFLDCDDWFDNDKVLERLHNQIITLNYPDVMRLPYNHVKDGKKTSVMLTDNTPKDLVNSCFVAPWTKCVKTELVVDFPENTLIEDVVQHIAQCDDIESVGVCTFPVICWNRDNIKSISLEENKYLYNSKRISSIYRNVADLMDLECRHDYCEAHRKWRVECYKDMVKKGVEAHI